jgi:hypothetical protein
MKLLNETDLRLQFKTATGLGSENNKDQYIKFLEEELLKYQNAELIANEANEAIVNYCILNSDRQEKKACENCNCHE